MRPPLLALLAACAGPIAPDASAPAVVCGAVAQRYAPFASAELEMFPDPLLVVDDRTAPGGQRLLVDPSRSPWAVGLAPLMQGLVDALPEANGFSRQGAIVLRFTGDVGDLPDGASPGPELPLRLVDLDAEPPEDVPFSTSKGPDGSQLLVQPLRPLRPAARHAVVLTRGHLAPDGRCVHPSPAMAALLDGSERDPRLVRLIPRYADAMGRLGLRAEDLTLLVPFTTADARGPLRDAAEAVRALDLAWTEPPVCEARAWGARCEGTFRGYDFRRDGGLVQASPWSSWELRAVVHLPASPGLHPFVIYGHGINSSMGESELLAERVAQHGVVVASVDAMYHGAHPTRPAEGLPPLDFLGLNLTAGTLDGVQMRASFDQTTLDRLQLVRLLRANPDVDSDGRADISPTRLGYVGVSLGGLLGPAFLANSDATAAALPVGGGYLLKFATDMQLIGDLGPLFAALLGGDDAFSRFLAVGQTAVDGSDPAVWAAHVLRDRVDDGVAPHLLLPVAIADEVVPPSTGQALARAFGLPHIQPVSEPIPLVGPEQPAPARANLDRVVTAGFFQLSTVTNGGVTETAYHANTPLSDEASAQWTEFIRTWAIDGTPTIINPYDNADPG